MRLIDADALIKSIPYEEIASRMAVMNAPTIEERKTGKWFDRFTSEEKAIEEWQTCKCSVCGRYDTRPYMYYFTEPNFCSWCGADMRGDKHEGFKDTH